MPVTLQVDGDRWRAHLLAVAKSNPHLVPVAKGNGYGFGMPRLARRAGWLGSDTLAVGTYEEVAGALSRFPGDVQVLSPWRPFLREVSFDPRVIHTLGRFEDVGTLAAQARAARARVRVVLEGLTSMTRHGLHRDELDAAAGRLGGLRLTGLALHLPMSGDRLGEAERWAALLRVSRLATTTLYVSHLSGNEVTTLAGRHPALTVRPRIGTALWLGDRSALRVTATVLDSHRVRRGARVGYRQRPLPRAGTVLVVSGGTAHGIGLEAPAALTSIRQRAVSAARGGLEAAGLALSPFQVAGRQRWFVESPHMQVSLIFVPSAVPAPAVGDELDLDVRLTTTTFDRVVIQG